MLLFKDFWKGVSEFAHHLPYFIAWWVTWQVMDLIWELFKATVVRAGN